MFFDIFLHHLSLCRKMGLFMKINIQTAADNVMQDSYDKNMCSNHKFLQE
ncbi:hypothetical protein B4065_0986 [Caldibacillus thermoamylovorans]|nr:hypothetical protein B4065_0986 [Caldibacillus thermoamylovorans]KIO66547.1 hypothetical protein B4166_2513 [Caldibacillus thermoamylovorans]